MMESTPAPFAYRASRDGVVTISRNGKPVTILRGAAAVRFLGRVAELDEAGVQLELARVTGNFKRGNERVGRRRERNRD